MKTLTMTAAAAVAFGLFACGEDSEPKPASETGGQPSATTGGTGASGAEPGQTGGSENTGGAPAAAGATATGGMATGGTPQNLGTVIEDDFESGAGNWDAIQGTCTITTDTTNVFTCVNGGNEARAVGGDPTWVDMTVTADVKITQMDDGRRIYLAGRYIDADNWYGAAFYNSGTRRVQIRKKVDGSSSDIAEATFFFEFDTWYTLQLKISGTTLTLSVDGVVMVEGTDTQFAAGGVAFLVDRSEVSWDNVVVTVP